jgi:hypothetical protein
MARVRQGRQHGLPVFQKNALAEAGTPKSVREQKGKQKEGRKFLPSGLQPRLGDRGVIGIDFNADVAPT